MSVFDNTDDAMWLLYADFVAFAIVGIITFRQLMSARVDARLSGGSSSGPPPVSVAGGETRALFMLMLFLSNASRAFSFLVEWAVIAEMSQKSMRTWVKDVLLAFPSLLFLSTYSIVILFWAQVYYASVLVSFPLLKPIVVFINIAVYVVFGVIAVMTLLLMAWSEFRTYVYFVFGFLYLFCGFNFFYYGVKVAAQLSERNKQLSRKGRIVRRVLVLTCTIPIILLARGMYCLAVAVGLLETYSPSGVSRLAWDCGVYFVSEFVPSVLMVLVFWPGNPRADAYEPPSSLLSSHEETPTSLHTPFLRQHENDPQYDEPTAQRGLRLKPSGGSAPALGPGMKVLEASAHVLQRSISEKAFERKSFTKNTAVVCPQHPHLSEVKRKLEELQQSASPTLILPGRRSRSSYDEKGGASSPTVSSLLGGGGSGNKEKNHLDIFERPWHVRRPSTAVQ